MSVVLSKPIFVVMKRANDFSAKLLRRLLVGAGVASGIAHAGCDATNGGAGGAGGSASTSNASTSASGSGVTTTSGKSTSSAATTGVTSAATTTVSTGTGMSNVQRCFSLPTTGCPSLADATTQYGPCTSMSEAILGWISGPTANGTQCCYQVDVSNPGDPTCGVPGRPFVVDGRARVAPITSNRRDWSVRTPSRRRRRVAEPSLPAVASLDQRTRERLAGEWATDAANEHASIASFAKLGLELMAFGAPSDLVRRAHEAALDEVRHAEIGFAIASAYLGAPMGPSGLAEARAFSGATSLGDLAAAAVREGCFGETVAAIIASKQSVWATDPALSRSFDEIARDEAEHAELAFAVVSWAITVGGEEARARARVAAEEALDELRAAARHCNGQCEGSLRTHARLTKSELAAERLGAALLVVVPALRALVG